MTPNQVSIIKRTVKQFDATAFYLELKRLFVREYGSKGADTYEELFKYADMNEQKTKLLGMLCDSVAALDDLSTIVPRLQKLGHRHANNYHVKDEHYALVGEALLFALRLTHPDEIHAWQTVYDTIATVMIAAGKENSNAQPDV